VQNDPLIAFGISSQIILGAFSIAIAVFVIAVLLRKIRHPRVMSVVTPPPLPLPPVALEQTLCVATMPENPYASPISAPPSLPAITITPDEGRVPTWWCNAVDWLGLALIIGVFLLFGLSATMAEKLSSADKITPVTLLSNVVIFAFLVGMVTLMVWWRIKPVSWLGLRWKQWWLALVIGPCVVICMWVFLILLQVSGYIAWSEKLIGGSSMQDAVKMLKESKDSLSVALMAFSAVIVAPIAEEVIFRGYVYPVAKKLAGMKVAFFFSALVFAAAHGNVTLLLPLFVLALLLAAAYEYTGSIWACIAIHFCFNGATVAMQLAARSGLLTLPDSMP
jgi:uncharacterized protein